MKAGSIVMVNTESFIGEGIVLKTHKFGANVLFLRGNDSERKHYVYYSNLNLK